MPGNEKNPADAIIFSTFYGCTPVNWLIADIPSSRHWYYDPEDSYVSKPQLVRPNMLNSLTLEISKKGDAKDRSVILFIDFSKYRRDLILYNFSVLSTRKYQISKKIVVPVIQLLMVENEYLSYGIGYYKKYDVAITIKKNPRIILSPGINLAFMPFVYHYKDISGDFIVFPQVSIRYNKFQLRCQLFVLSGKLLNNRKRNFYRYYPKIQLGISSDFQRFN